MTRLRCWETDENYGTEYTATVDGEPVNLVRVLDTGEGWVSKYCEDDSHADSHPHMDPECPDEPCIVTVRGRVAVRGPDGGVVDLSERPWPWESNAA